MYSKYCKFEYCHIFPSLNVHVILIDLIFSRQKNFKFLDIFNFENLVIGYFTKYFFFYKVFKTKNGKRVTK